MAYGDVGGPNLDFSNMGCLGFCPEEFTFGDWLLLLVIIIATLYIVYWIIKIARILIVYTINRYKSKNEYEGFSNSQRELMKLINEKEERSSFNVKNELVVLLYCSIVAFLVIIFIAIAFS